MNENGGARRSATSGAQLDGDEGGDEIGIISRNERRNRKPMVREIEQSGIWAGAAGRDVAMTRRRMTCSLFVIAAYASDMGRRPGPIVKSSLIIS
jgi:hypothetical protein